jgi:hypothetical protein
MFGVGVEVAQKRPFATKLAVTAGTKIALMITTSAVSASGVVRFRHPARLMQRHWVVIMIECEIMNTI